MLLCFFFLVVRECCSTGQGHITALQRHITAQHHPDDDGRDAAGATGAEEAAHCCGVASFGDRVGRSGDPRMAEGASHLLMEMPVPDVGLHHRKRLGGSSSSSSMTGSVMGARALQLQGGLAGVAARASGNSLTSLQTGPISILIGQQRGKGGGGGVVQGGRGGSRPSLRVLQQCLGRRQQELGHVDHLHVKKGGAWLGVRSE